MEFMDESKRAFNFCAGPATLPTSVLEQAQSELLNWQDKGISVMEMSHRSSDYIGIAEQAEQDLRDLLSIPNDYHILFMQGGASLQFSAVPLNLLANKQTADYIDTGIWSKKSIQEAQRLGAVNIAYSAQCNDYTRIASSSDWSLSDNPVYVHYTSNETIGGLQFQSIPDVGERPLIADMSSDILSRPLDISRFGLIYAGAQKNIGPSGLTVVIIRDDLLDCAHYYCPTLLKYQTVAMHKSMANTPATYSWYLAGLVLQWVKQQGGLSVMLQRNCIKKTVLYQAIDQSDFYYNTVVPEYRSWMNVPFFLMNEDLNELFLLGAEQRGLLNLKGHRLQGGMRASIYNALELNAVNALVDYMHFFEKEYA
ncbi:UNVERIFIED_CONTAM: hypothetical protein GTU68_008988 [Idotea baltica]|nr:hypothetical protein [Idotea baltica]